MSLPKRCVVDTNVPVTANKANSPEAVPEEFIDCVAACIVAIEHVISAKALVLDAGDEIFQEYIDNVSLSGQPGVGDKFGKWVHYHRHSLPPDDLVWITPRDGSYEEFPNSQELAKFDRSDHKFVAVANAHKDKPAILQATDSKWWGYRDALKDVGITVDFLCKKYISAMHYKKIARHLPKPIRKPRLKITRCK